MLVTNGCMLLLLLYGVTRYNAKGYLSPNSAFIQDKVAEKSTELTIVKRATNDDGDNNDNDDKVEQDDMENDEDEEDIDDGETDKCNQDNTYSVLIGGKKYLKVIVNVDKVLGLHYTKEQSNKRAITLMRRQCTPDNTPDKNPKQCFDIVLGQKQYENNLRNEVNTTMSRISRQWQYFWKIARHRMKKETMQWAVLCFSNAIETTDALNLFFSIMNPVSMAGFGSTFFNIAKRMSAKKAAMAGAGISIGFLKGFLVSLWDYISRNKKMGFLEREMQLKLNLYEYTYLYNVILRFVVAVKFLKEETKDGNLKFSCDKYKSLMKSFETSVKYNNFYNLLNVMDKRHLHKFAQPQFINELKELAKNIIGNLQKTKKQAMENVKNLGRKAKSVIAKVILRKQTKEVIQQKDQQDQQDQQDDHDEVKTEEKNLDEYDGNMTMPVVVANALKMDKMMSELTTKVIDYRFYYTLVYDLLERITLVNQIIDRIPNDEKPNNEHTTYCTILVQDTITRILKYSQEDKQENDDKYVKFKKTFKFVRDQAIHLLARDYCKNEQCKDTS